jgi:GNAT superfamily N-acetyltransferase
MDLEVRNRAPTKLLDSALWMFDTLSSMKPLDIEEFPLGDPRIREFAEFPWHLYRGDPHWTPPLRADLLGSTLLGLKGLLTSAHPYHARAEVTHFLARRGKRVVGRISAAVNHRFNDYYNTRIGSFGFFEVAEDYEAASALLDAARAWVVNRGMTAMRGPGEYSCATHERQGVLIQGFDTPPTVECTHNPPYYGDFLERWGLAKVKDYYGYLMKMDDVPAVRLSRVASGVRKRSGVTTRAADLSDFTNEIRNVVDVYNRAWSENWGFLPLTQAEADAVADSLRLIVDPGLVRFAEHEGRRIAMLGAFPDPNWALRPRWGLLGDSDLMRLTRLLLLRRRIPRVRLMFMGVDPEHRLAGVDALLFDEAYRYGLSRGYTTFEGSLLLEDNEMVIRACEFAGGTRYKTWRIYECPI